MDIRELFSRIERHGIFLFDEEIQEIECAWGLFQLGDNRQTWEKVSRKFRRRITMSNFPEWVRYPENPANIPAIRRAIEKAVADSGCWLSDKDYLERLSDVGVRILNELTSQNLYQVHPGMKLGTDGEPDIILTFHRAGYEYRFEVDVTDGRVVEKVTPP